jgi:hypothetical protein
MRVRALRVGLPLLLLGLRAGPLRAQDLDPRAYAVTPVGTNIGVFLYSRLSGDVLFDPSLPITNVSATFDGFALGYYRSIDFFGRSANVRIAVPYAVGHVQGEVQEAFTRVYRSGLSDIRVQTSVNLLGGPAVGLEGFARRRPTRGVFASFTVSAPTGQYSPDKLVNIGTNRWAFKPEVAVSQPLGRWTLEGYGGAWFFTTNHEFFRGTNVRSQDPMLGIQGHVSYTFHPGLWAALDGTYYRGGATTVNGVFKNDEQSASRIGVVGSWSFAPRNALKFQYTRTSTVRVGGRFNILTLGYAFTWFDR